MTAASAAIGSGRSMSPSRQMAASKGEPLESISLADTTSVANIRQPRAAGLLGHKLDHHGRDVSRKDEARGTDPSRRHEGLIARPTGKVDNPASRANMSHVEECVCGLREPAAHH